MQFKQLLQLPVNWQNQYQITTFQGPTSDLQYYGWGGQHQAPRLLLAGQAKQQIFRVCWLGQQSVLAPHAWQRAWPRMQQALIKAHFKYIEFITKQRVFSLLFCGFSETKLAQGYRYRYCCYRQKILILGGGGAHGSYQWGALQVLRATGWQPDLIISSSVGALNSVLYLTTSSQQAQVLWQQMTWHQIIDLPSQQARPQPRHFPYATTPLANLIQHYWQPASYRQHKIALAVTTTRLAGLRPLTHLLRLDAPDNPQWLRASASFFPVMTPTKIAGQTYLDGGVRNDLAIGLASQLHGRQLLAIDCQGLGPVPSYQLYPGQHLLRLRSRWSLGGFTQYETQQATFNLKLGALEMKRCLRPDWFGYWYTLTAPLPKQWGQCWRQQCQQATGRRWYRQLCHFCRVPALTVPQQLTGVLEYLAHWVQVPPTCAYTPQHLLQAICQQPQRLQHLHQQRSDALTQLALGWLAQVK